MLEELAEISQKLYLRVKEYAEIMAPENIILIKGKKEEYTKLVNEMVDAKELLPLNASAYPNCYLYRSDKNDVARTEENTYICTKNKDEVGPTNNWVEADEMEARLKSLLVGIMHGKTMYIVPYLLGPVNSDYTSCGVEITDSKYVVVSEMIISNVGLDAINCIKKSDDFVFGIQATGTLDPKMKYIAHFPEKNLIITVNSAYGGNALLSKKGHALRIESVRAIQKDMLIEHMMSIEVITPDGKEFGIAGAFPSSSGKTNLAMISPPEDMNSWKVRLLSDDISWFKLYKGSIYATNPEYGFFGVVPGTNYHTNKNAMLSIKANTIFTNVAYDPNTAMPWWEGLEDLPPKGLEDWQGNKEFKEYAAHPNSRFTSPIKQYPFLSTKYGTPEGLKMHAILFGGRRKTLIPLVYEAFSIEHGILIGAMLRAESTFASTGKQGIIKNDPMAMRPFCGYNMADYFNHFREVINKASEKPKFYGVNWFRVDSSGKYIWPGFSENMRVIEWITKRLEGKAKAIESPIGLLPDLSEINYKISKQDIELLFAFDKNGWKKELEEVKPFFESFGERFPSWLWDEFYKLKDRVESW
ncbi:MAG: phosphoenolpyruvate carboxykinase (GTP) [Candidatus Micrarchaeaceae archaeon]